MSEIAGTTSAPARTASTSVFVATLALVLVATVLMLSLDLFLARVDRRESRAHAANEYSDGLALLRAGHAREAADRFAEAVAIDRTNVNYGLALGEALLDEGRTADAETTLRALLDRAENDGAVNLTMARVMLRESRTEDAKAYFHRAIFGQWGADSVARRAEARFDLIALLAREGSQGELLAELLPFEETPPDSVALRHRLAHLFILAGSPARAATIFRELLRRDPRDADAYTGLGEAALALGNLQTAYADLTEASRLGPDNVEIARRLAVADTALSLDPMVPNIGAHARYVRSRALLARTMATVATCLPTPATALSDSARTLLSSPDIARREEGLGTAMQTLASELWAARVAACPPAARDTVLRLVHGRLAQ
jgi:predicted Zn-dependent protease